MKNGYFKPNQPLTRQHFSEFLALTISKKGAMEINVS